MNFTAPILALLSVITLTYANDNTTPDPLSCWTDGCGDSGYEMEGDYWCESGQKNVRSSHIYYCRPGGCTRHDLQCPEACHGMSPNYDDVKCVTWEERTEIMKTKAEEFKKRPKPALPPGWDPSED